MGSKKRKSFKTERTLWQPVEQQPNLKTKENVDHVVDHVDPKTQTPVSASKVFLIEADDCSHAENYNIKKSKITIFITSFGNNFGSGPPFYAHKTFCQI